MSLHFLCKCPYISYLSVQPTHLLGLFPVIDFVLHVLHLLPALPPQERADGYYAHDLRGHNYKDTGHNYKGTGHNYQVTGHNYKGTGHNYQVTPRTRLQGRVRGGIQDTYKATRHMICEDTIIRAQDTIIRSHGRHNYKDV